MPPKHRRAERFDAGREAHVEIDLLEHEGVADAGDPGHGAAQSESEHYDFVDVDPHQSGRVGVLRDRAHRRSHPRALHDEVEDRHRDERGGYDHDLEDRNAEAEERRSFPSAILESG